jgi:dihydrofolate reductase
MRKIVESTLVSLDGVFGNPHVWATGYFDREAEDFALALLSNADAMLMGRRSYEFFSAAFPHQTGAYGARVNEIPKYVFSQSLTRAEWGNATIVRGDLAAEVEKLKNAKGGDLVIYGHGELARALVAAGLLDELKIWIHPCFVGSGALLFREGEKSRLRLVEIKTLGTGVAVATYKTRLE